MRVGELMLSLLKLEAGPVTQNTIDFVNSLKTNRMSINLSLMSNL